jgi:hypothetical protein
VAERQRFKVHAYVGLAGEVHEPRIEGWALPGDIWYSVPALATRFIVVEAGPLPEFLVWAVDMARVVRMSAQKDPPTPAFKAPSADAAMMWAVHHA